MRFEILLPALLLAAAPAHAQEPAAALGKQLAASSRLAWAIGDGAHPTLGPIRFAVLKPPVSTPVGDARVSSRMYFSCERNTTTIAIELANGTGPDDTGGLHPRSMPRLTCYRASGGKLAPSALPARWEVNALGDALARGIAPASLRACASIGVVQEVVLPKDWKRATARIEFEVTPYSPALDSILYTCGQGSVYAAAHGTPPLPSGEGRGEGKKTLPAGERRGEGRGKVTASTWQPARTVATGRTNLRAGPSIRAKVVAQLPPDVAVLVQKANDDWYRVKPAGHGRFEGFVREDRLVIQ